MIVAVLVATITMLLGDAPSPAAEPLAVPTVGAYVRMCHFAPRGSKHDAVNEDGAIVNSVREAFKRRWVAYTPPSDVRTIEVAVRMFQNYLTPSPTFENPAIHTISVMHVQTDSAANSWVRADLDQSGTVIALSPLTIHDLAFSVTFARGIAAFALLNDLLADDAVVPRNGCTAAMDDQMASIPIVLPEIDRAFAVAPAPDLVRDAAIAAAFERFRIASQDASTPGASITQETLRKIGSSPKISVVYDDLDAVTGSGNRIDVVRIGERNRSYMTVEIEPTGSISIDAGTVICVVGDIRCAQYYVWP